MIKPIAGKILCVCALALPAWTQTFEVASIKPNRSDDHRVMFGMAPGGRVTASNMSVKQLIMMAYGIKSSQLSGGPGWADSERFDIVAKPEAPASAEQKITQDQIKLMLQALLKDRFQLTLRSETKELPTYALVAAKNGPKLTESEVQGGQAKRGIRMGRGLLEGQQMSMAMFADSLSTLVGRTVIDKTGLTANYEVNLEWTPEEGQGAMLKTPTDGRDVPPPAEASGPSLFSAMQEQLGLKLEPQKGQVEVFLIERVEKPTEN